jgi:lipopolysaccharide biosynthesis glycosyltransferase
VINLVLATDSNNLWGLAVTVRSALEHCSTTCNVYILSVNLKPSEKLDLINSWKMPNAGTIEFFPLDESKVAPFRTTLFVKSKATYARLYMDEYLPSLSRCLYLDTDLIVCSDITELYNTDLKGNITGGVRDISSFNEVQLARFKDKLGLKNPSFYFNAGVMLIDLDAWKKDKVGSQAIKIGVEKYDLLDLGDQDALNIVLEDKWLNLDAKWNTSKYDASEDFNDGIIHLLGRVKPWHADYDYKFKERFFDILDRTSYAGKRPANLLGTGAISKKISRLIPTMEMVQGKLRRMLS